MELEPQLKKAGLSKSEIRVYLYDLAHGISTPPQIAKGTGIARTNTYHILRSLKEQELVESQSKGKREAYIATDPSSIVRNIEERKVAMETILPDLRALYTTQKNKPSIRFYDGWEQVKQIYMQTLEFDSLQAIGSTAQLHKVDQEFFAWYWRQIKSRHIILNDILTQDSRELTKKIKEEMGALYTAKLLPKKYSSFPTDTFLWGDSIALISLEEPIFGTVLTNKNLAQIFRIMFEMIWQSSEEVS